jgi:hypothetical protein
MRTLTRPARTYDRREELDSIKCTASYAFEKRVEVVGQICQQLGLTPPAAIFDKYDDVPLDARDVKAWGGNVKLLINGGVISTVHAHLQSLPQTTNLWNDFLWLMGLVEGLNFDHASSDIPLVLIGFRLGRKAVEDVRSRPDGVGFKSDDRLHALWDAVRQVSERPTIPKVL